jgi:hypothetical protein
MAEFKPIKITYKFTRSWPDDKLNRVLREMTTELILTVMDLQEVDVSDSENKDAIRMLKEIGIEN